MLNLLLSLLIAPPFASRPPASTPNTTPASLAPRRPKATSESVPARLAHDLWSRMADNRQKLERGSFIATGRRLLDDWTIRSHADGEVMIVGAFDSRKGLWRFDRSEPLPVPAPLPDDPSAIPLRLTGKLIMTPDQNIRWSDMRAPAGAVVISRPEFAVALYEIAPFDVRSLGLLFWNRDSTLIGFEPVLKTWTDARLEEVAKESEHLFRITSSSGQNNAVRRTVWVDASRGFTPTRCEVAVGSAPPMFVSEMVWVQIHGIWIPKKYRNERYGSQAAEIYDLSFKWTSVNKPIEDSLFTVTGLDLEKNTPVLERKN
jgi:hypothetical protein